MEVILLYLGVCCVLAFWWAAKKRIGDLWGFFFVFFFSPIVGSILISMSPSKKNLSSIKDGYYGLDNIIAIVTFLLAAFFFYDLVRVHKDEIFFPELRKARMLRDSLAAIGMLGTAFYMFNRFKRHENIYNKLNTSTDKS